MASTPNYLWPTPDDTDPVGDGALDMRTLANAIDASLLLNPNAGLRNRLINGSMEFWQRGTTAVTTDQTYSADRFIVQRAISTISVTRAAVAPNAVTPGIIKYATAYTVTAGGTAASYAVLAQRIEDVGTLAGQNVTVSFYAYASAANLEIACSMQQNYGTGGAPSANVDVLAYTARKTSSLSTSAWNRYSFSFNVPSINGKTRGTNNNDYLSLLIWLDAGSNFNTQTGTLGPQTGTFYITGVQVEQGPGASTFEERPRQTELALCQRYFYLHAIGSGQPVGIGTYSFASQVSTVIGFPVTMRNAPTLLIQAGTNYYVSTYGLTSDYLNSLTLSAASTTMAVLYNGTDASGTAYQSTIITTANASSYIGFPAEL